MNACGRGDEEDLSAMCKSCGRLPPFVQPCPMRDLCPHGTFARSRGLGPEPAQPVLALPAARAHWAQPIFDRFSAEFELHKPCSTCTAATGKDEMCTEGRRLYVGMLDELKADGRGLLE